VIILGPVVEIRKKDGTCGFTNKATNGARSRLTSNGASGSEF
jgi:hypothetical protein